MARALGRSPSTITREFERNTLAALPYGSHTAQVSSTSKRVACRPAGKLDFDSVGWSVVRTLLDWKWSPQQIAATLKRVYPDEPERHVSHETIYTAIYAQPRGELRKQLVACLRHGRSTRMPRSPGGRPARPDPRHGQHPCASARGGRPRNARPLGGRLHQGCGQQVLGSVLVERTSRLVLLGKMDDATAASALAGFSATLNSIAAPLRKSFTYDQGSEMSRHVDLAAQTGVKVYFFDPHSPWQRGACKNTNGLLRQYLPKGADLSVFSQEELDGIADSLHTSRALRTIGTPRWRCSRKHWPIHTSL